MKKAKNSSIILLSIFVLTGACDNGEDMLSDLSEDTIVREHAGRIISSEDPFTRHTQQVGPTAGEFFSYIDEGIGDPIILLHGAPSYSYLWRNIIPYVSDNARVIAIDWMGSGNSGSSPGNDYSYLQQLEYLESFIDQLNLSNITFVMHDWSTIPGLIYSHQN